MFVRKNIKKTIQQFCQEVQNQGYPLDKVVLFGSYAKDLKGYHDIDVALFSKKFGKDRTDELMMLNKLTTKVNPILEPHPFNTSDWNDKYSTLIAEIKKWGKELNIP